MKNNTGWICPVCGKVHAPWVPSCECSEQIKYDINTYKTNGVDTMKFVPTCTSENFGQEQQMICD